MPEKLVALILVAFFIFFGLSGVLQKRLVLGRKHNMRTQPLEIHYGESAVIWGFVFLSLGLFLGWVFFLGGLQFLQSLVRSF